ncbi:MAG: group I truncated hemoglobin [Rhodanobacteraceae bacterium]
MNRGIRSAIAVAALIAAGCAGTAQKDASKPPAHATPAAHASASAPANDRLYRALGGEAGIASVVDAALVEIHNDLRINLLFEKTDLADLRRLVIEQLCAATGGPCEYTGRSMEEAHSGLNLTDADFDAFVDDLVRAMNAKNVPADLQKELLGLLGPMRPEVVGQ